MGDLDGALSDRDEPAVGQHGEHVGHVLVALEIELGEWCAATNRRVAFVFADEPQEDGALTSWLRSSGMRA